jgi:hypothetical protein
MTRITVMSNAYPRGWPAEEDKPLRETDRAYVLPLAEALEREYRSDAHFVAYPTMNGYRLKRGALDQGVTIELGVIVFDLDGPNHAATPEWRAETRQKVCALFEAEGRGFYYETRGGARIIYRQEEPTIIQSQADAQEWSLSYVTVVANLARRFGLEADRACKDWQRLFRLPHATREGELQNRPSFGDAENIANFFVRVTEEDIETAKKSLRGLRNRRKAKPATCAVGGDGLFFHLLRARGHIGGNASRRTGGWICLCPNRSQHSTNTDWTDTTVLEPPGTGEEVGLIRCKHGHCDHRFTVAEWLRMFSDSELDAAREAAGIRQKVEAA